MGKTSDASCDCKIKAENSACQENASPCDGEYYACDKFSDPRWIKINIDYFPAGFEAPTGIFKHISPEEAHRMLRENNRAYKILDVKTEEEYRRIHLPGSLNLDFFSPTFKDDLFGMDKGQCYLVICKIGMRSEIAMNLMRKMGFREVYNVAGGDDRWTAEEIPFNEARRAAACCN